MQTNCFQFGDSFTAWFALWCEHDTHWPVGKSLADHARHFGLLCREHLITTTFSSRTYEDCEQELRDRMDQTLDAAASSVSDTFTAHVDIILDKLAADLIPTCDKHYR